MALAFASVSFVSVAMCLVLVSLLGQVSGLVMDMREGEGAIRKALSLAVAVREQYIHLAHDVVGGDGSHLEHYADWHQAVVRGARELLPLCSSSEREHLGHIERLSGEMDARFRDVLLPALTRGDTTVVHSEHRRIVGLAERAAAHADTVAASVEGHMVRHHVLANRATDVGLWAGGVGALLVLALSFAHTVHLRKSVLRPLRALARAAGRLGAGELDTRTGPIGRGELQAVASAFDRMAGEIAERETRLVQSERMAAIGQLAAGVAHELNNPIGIIRGYLKTMSPEESADTLREELRILDEEAEHCQRIAEDLLVYARMSELRIESVPMRDFLQETVRRLDDHAIADSARIELSAEEGTVQADRHRLRQLVTNLAMNASQASSEPATVSIRGTNVASAYEIEVADRGAGIPEEDRGRIFEPFFGRRKGGSGLGLAVCLGIVRAHEGSIEVQERPGGGTIVLVRIPRHPKDGHGG